jgi:HD superfamily phosphohydrolase
LLRDAHFTGVGYGKVDLDWLLRSLRFGHSDDPERSPPLAIDGSKGLPAIESFILARLFMFEQVYFHKASRSSEWLLSRILDRAAELIRDGARLPDVPPALIGLTLQGDTDLDKYLALDDSSLWYALTAWRESKDPVLADLCQRLHARRLFKTLRLYGADQGPDTYGEARDIACELVRARGLDPDV